MKGKRDLRKAAAAGLVLLMTVLSLCACGQDTGAGSSVSTASEVPKEASADNTELSAGTWTGTIGDREVTIEAAYLVDGIDAVIDGGTYESAQKDQTVFLVVNGGSLTITNAEIVKTNGEETDPGKAEDQTAAEGSGEQSSVSVDDGQGGQQPPEGGTPPEMPEGGTPPEMPAGGAPGQGGDISSAEDGYNFYGLNSAIVCVGEDSTVSIENCLVETDAEGANAVFSTDGANIEVAGIGIDTQQNSSRGLYATYGGTITAEDVTIETQGAHCAPLATDRGGGTVIVSGESTLTAHGEGSPCIYSTGDIQVTGATGSSDLAQTLVIEGKNKVTLKDCDLSSSSDNDGIMLYQSMSGDAADEDAAGNVSTLTMEDTTLHYTGEGPFLYVTNTTTEVYSKNCTFDYEGDTLISAAAGRWGSDGSNGGTLTFTGDSQKLAGKISADGISRITVSLTNGSSHEGETEGAVSLSEE